MKFAFSNLLFVLAPSLILSGGRGNYASAKVIEYKDGGIKGEYFFVMKDEADKGEGSISTLSDVDLQNMAISMVDSVKGVKEVQIYRKSFTGFFVKGIDSGSVKRIASENSRIMFAEQVIKMSKNVIEEVDQSGATWGLDRIDQRDLPLDERYNVVGDGTGITVYVIDTGIRITHNEFGGRAIWGTNTFGDNIDTDCDGHGTHVAGTVGASTYGVAKNVELIAVKVFDCEGNGSSRTVIDGIEWAENHAQSNGKIGVVNMSLGGGTSSALDLAVRNLDATGLVPVVAAGNENQDACNTSPAREPLALTVGSTTRNDERSSFSNFGTCLDIFGPGSSITSAGIESDTDLAVLSGTSMATPHVAGAVALLMQKGIDNVKEEIMRRATVGTLTGVGNGSVNKLLYTGEIGPTNAPTPQPPTTAPTPCPYSTVIIEIQTDDYPLETSWTLTNECTGEVQADISQGQYTAEITTFVEEECVPTDSYTFVISDSFNDGICCSFGGGSYKVTYDEVEVASGGEFDSSEATTFGSCGDSPVTPGPTTSSPVTPIPTTSSPVTPAPTTSSPVTPAPTTSSPVTPAPTTSSPVTPAPTDSPVSEPTSDLAPIFQEDFEDVENEFKFTNRSKNRVVNQNSNCFENSSCIRLEGKKNAVSLNNFPTSSFTEIEVSFRYVANLLGARNPLRLNVKINGGRWSQSKKFRSDDDSPQEGNAVFVVPQNIELETFRIRFRNTVKGVDKVYFIENVVVRGKI